MKRVHLSLAVLDFTASVADYSKRLGCVPCVVAEGRYALWRTDLLNFSISCKPDEPTARIRHIGFEDDAAKGFREEKDINGISWEYFSPGAQAAEIREKIPGAKVEQP